MRQIQNITGLMVRDHERLMKIFNDFKNIKNKDFKKSRKLFSRIDRELRNHIKIEEKIINSICNKNTDNRLLSITSTLKSDHDRIINILEKNFVRKRKILYS